MDLDILFGIMGSWRGERREYKGFDFIGVGNGNTTTNNTEHTEMLHNCIRNLSVLLHPIPLRLPFSPF
jgi:hypothetical protein